jgi:outer membrane scaffolding protein for murein synthesis (MipA/OmpV family)
VPQAVRRLILLVFVLCGVAAGEVAVAEEEPPTGRRLELGGGVGLLSRPDYRGSTEVSTTVLPLPYASYESERVELSRDGLDARLFRSERVRLGFSASASLPGDGSQDTVRRGMPDLRPTFEIGPALEVKLGEHWGTWHLDLPMRAVAAVDFDGARGIGWLAAPDVRVEKSWALRGWNIESEWKAGPLWASRKYHAYFYGVAPRFETPDRPAYDARSGYSGARTAIYLGLRRGAWRIGAGVTHDWLAGAVMRDSPLVETRHGTVVAIGVFYSWWTFKSATAKGPLEPADPASSP